MLYNHDHDIQKIVYKSTGCGIQTAPPLLLSTLYKYFYAIIKMLSILDFTCDITGIKF